MIEVEGCINGLRQYGTTYEECYAQADALQHSYDEARTRGLAAAALASAQAQAAGPMDVTPESSLPLAVSFVSVVLLLLHRCFPTLSLHVSSLVPS